MEYGYDPRGRLRTVHALLDGQTLLLLNYTYDPEGNIVELQTETHLETYTYDQADRLTSWTGPLGVWRYQYDLAGNRVELQTPEKYIPRPGWRGLRLKKLYGYLNITCGG